MRPLSDIRYAQAAKSETYLNQSSGFYDPQAARKPASKRKWWIIGAILLLLVIAAAVVGGILGSNAAKKNASSASSGSSSAGGSGANGGSGPISGGQGGPGGAGDVGRFAIATDTYFLPIYPTETNQAVYGSPTFIADASTASSDGVPSTFPADPWSPGANPDPTVTRPDRPRLIAPSYKWAALPAMIAEDPYLWGWNETIFGNATFYYNEPLTNYSIDGGYSGSGVLDVARQVKVKVKSWAYAYRMTNDSTWVDRTWRELVNAAGNNTDNFFGEEGNNWNYYHFLDVGEFTAAFAIAYDWLYDVWQPSQREALMWSIIDLGLTWGIEAYTNQTFTNDYGWWNAVNGNWNCVCNGGLTLGALAILGDDPTGIAAQMLNYTVPDAKANCAMAPSTDGTWSETANYWYFGTTAHAEMTSSLITATGSDYGLLTANPSFNDTALFHIYVTGMTSLFNYGDHGPNKYSTTANGMLFYGTQYDTPVYTLFQRDRFDAAEPWSMFWYDGSVAGGWWDGLPLDHYFDNGLDQWASMRSSWTDNNGTYVAMKSGNHTGHQTHGDLDGGDFVLDFMGQRFAGELGSGDYLSTGYFSSEGQDSQRWLYYRKRTEGQNAVVVGLQNQNADAQPTANFGTTGESQDYTTTYTTPAGSTAFFTTDLTSTYFNVTSYQRGVVLLNNRRQVLIQDDIVSTASVQWRMHTNATITYQDGNTTAILTLGGQTCEVKLLNIPTGTGATFQTLEAARYPSDPPLPPGQVDQPNPGVSVLSVTFADGGSYSIQVLFNPQWDDMSASDFVTPPNVPVSQWTVTSHNS
ncbi:hypothetical protein CALVIDRAFT_490810 [Calocera viscosa TUFC12733]|uniref:Heparinase II/III family protein n=1 Tax=Calocera viscosa (strain TUFC12733) TaxID=1330018 RepID=A0A167G6M9_CALVF|nr:hypothetical protein CALVIDRAFT_490810 [Calocera viscosa TUFC12733]